MVWGIMNTARKMGARLTAVAAATLTALYVGITTGSGTAAGASVPGNQLGWTPTASSLAPGVTLGGTVTPAGPGLGTQPGFLAFAHAGSGYGTSTLGASLTLAIPATAAAGDYTGSLTVTAITALP